MMKSYNSYRHRATKIKNVAELSASTSFRRWIIFLLLLYKLDYKDYYCYGISSASGNLLNIENGKLNPLNFLISSVENGRVDDKSN